MKFLFLISVVSVSILSSCNSVAPSSSSNGIDTTSITIDSSFMEEEYENQLTSLAVIADAYVNNKSNIQILVRGKVTKLLADDLVGDRHQRFIITLNNNQTLLVAHNIDIGTKLPNSILQNYIYANGEYEWNSEGGVLHWTHADPAGKHANGWIRFEKIFY